MAGPLPGGPIPNNPTPGRELPRPGRYLLKTAPKYGPAGASQLVPRAQSDDPVNPTGLANDRNTEEGSTARSIENFMRGIFLGELDSPLAGKGRSAATEEGAKAVAGAAAKRVFFGLNLMGTGDTDPTGRSEPPAVPIDTRNLIRPIDLPKLTPQALVKVIGGTTGRPTISPSAQALGLAAQAELGRRGAAAAAAARGARITSALLGGLIGAPPPDEPVQEGGAYNRDDQGVAVLNAAHALGLLTRTIVFPGWAADP